jgi:DNA invertase Pin-like site-specific DNA recombinase
VKILVRVAIYIRVSTEDQAVDGFSLNAQRERLLAYCDAQGWEIYKVFDDEGYSGRNIKRPGYSGMLDDRDNWDMILVLKMDRIHRNSKNFMDMMDHLRKWGKEFSSMYESLDTSTAMGRFVVDIIQRIAQLESEQIGERVYTGMKQKARLGKGNLGSRVPFGYELMAGKYIPIESEADIVKQIYQRYLNGNSLSKIARELNKLGLTTRIGKPWTVWNVRYILHNTVYAGYMQWDGIINKWTNPPIIGLDTFNEVQNRLFKNRRNEKRGNEPLLLK